MCVPYTFIVTILTLQSRRHASHASPEPVTRVESLVHPRCLQGKWTRVSNSDTRTLHHPFTNATILLYSRICESRHRHCLLLIYWANIFYVNRCPLHTFSSPTDRISKLLFQHACNQLSQSLSGSIHSHIRTAIGSDAVGVASFRIRHQLVFRSHIAASGGTSVSKAGGKGLGWRRHPHHYRRSDEFPTAGMDAHTHTHVMYTWCMHECISTWIWRSNVQKF